MGEALMASVLDRPGSQEKFLTHGGKMFINNKWMDAKSGATLDVFDPSTGDVIAKVAAADQEDVDEAVKAARAAFRSEEHTSELQSLMRSSYAVFCLKKKTKAIQ